MNSLISLVLLGAFQNLYAEDIAPPANDRATLFLLRGDGKLQDDSRLGHKIAGSIGFDAGRFGQALDFRKEGHISVRLQSSATPRDAMSLECWVNLDERGDEKLQRVIGRSSVCGLYVVGRADRPSIAFYTRTSLADDNSWKSVSASLPLMRWVHLAATYDGINMRLYLDGKLAAERENKGTLIPSKAPFYVGTESGSSKLRFLGRIDEIRVSKVARVDFFSGKPLERPAPTTSLKIDKGSDLRLEPMLAASQKASPPKIDGNINDDFWKASSFSTFVESKEASKPNSPTHVKAAWDSKNLYLAFRGFEKGQETWREGTNKRDDTAIFHGDSIEIFLQPAGMSSYFQIAVNPVGGLWDARWLRPGKMEAWNGEGIRHAGSVRPDDWTIELAIPFKALSAESPTEGQEWRANFCRSEIPSRELTCWSFTGGGYHVPERFGHLLFSRQATESHEQTGNSQLSGLVQEESGEPVAGIAIRYPLGYTRTDAFGEFTIKDVPLGKLALLLESPRYERVAGTTEISAQVEHLAPIRLKRIDPYRPAFTLESDRTVTWLKSSITEPPDMLTMPTADERASSLKLLVTPSEYESRAVAFIAHEAINQPTTQIADLIDENGDKLACSIEVRWTQRLLKRKQYTRPREDAFFSWRYLWREAPDSVDQGHLRQLVATVKPDAAAKAGTYKNVLQLHSDGKQVAALPIEVEVLPFKLVKPKTKRVGTYYRGHGLSDEQLAIELDDIREHGGDLLVWHSAIYYFRQEDGSIGYNVSQVRHAIEKQRKHGIGPPYLVGTAPTRAAGLVGLKVRMAEEFANEVRQSEAFRKVYAGGIKALADLEKELDAGEFIYTWMDEVFGRGRFEPWKAFAEITRELSRNRIYITFHNRNQEQVDKADPWVDIRGYHGHTIDWWLGEGHTFEDLRSELQKSKDEAWNYYNIRESAVTSEWVRLCNGYWLWRSPITAHTPWTYYSYGESPFDDLDSDHHDFAYAAPHPTKPEMVSTLEWECFREGFDDLRYLATLEKSLGEAYTSGLQHAAVTDARSLLQIYWNDDPRVPVQAEKLTAEDYLERRESISRRIVALKLAQSEKK